MISLIVRYELETNVGMRCLLPVRWWDWKDGGTRDPRLASRKPRGEENEQLLPAPVKVAYSGFAQPRPVTGKYRFKADSISKQGAEPQSFNAFVNIPKAATQLSSPPCPNVLQKRGLVECILIPMRNKSGQVHLRRYEAEAHSQLQQRKHKAEAVSWGTSLSL